MTRKDERAERSRQRSEAYRKRMQTYAILFAVVVVFTLVIPLLWNGAVEFNLVQPLQNPDFKSDLDFAWALLALSGFYLHRKLWPVKVKKKEEKKEKSAVINTNETPPEQVRS